MWVQGRGFAAKPRRAWNWPSRPRRVRPLLPRGSTAAPTAGQGRGETGGGGNRGGGHPPSALGEGKGSRVRGWAAPGRPHASRSSRATGPPRSPSDKWAAGPSPRPAFRRPPRPFRFLPRPLQAARGFCQQPDRDPQGYGCRRACAGGVAGHAGAGNHPERLRGARGPAGPVHEAHRRGAAQPGRRPPPGGASPGASPGQVPAPPSARSAL